HRTESLRAISNAIFLDDLQNALHLKSISFSQLGRKLSQASTSFSKAFPGFSHPSPRENEISITSKNNHALKNLGEQSNTAESYNPYLGNIWRQTTFTNRFYGKRTLLP